MRRYEYNSLSFYEYNWAIKRALIEFAIIALGLALLASLSVSH